MKTVRVLLSTYNGEKYLREQIESLINQKEVEVEIFVRDDGSTDSTLEILEEYRKKGKLEYSAEKNVGYARSFLTLASYSINHADYYAFCDQDDIWLPEKLIKAVKKLEQVTNNKYKLYFSNLKITDENLEKIGCKDYSKRDISLGCAMVRHGISGCTMVFNNELLKLFAKRAFIEGKVDVGAHDAWIYKVCLSVGGAIVYDSNSYIYYRQHGKNVTGVRQGFKKRFSHELKGFTVNKNYKYTCAKTIYHEYFGLIPDENLPLLTEIVEYKESIPKTIKLLFNKELSFGIAIIDILNKLKILFRCY